jgi:hypothetical protein
VDLAQGYYLEEPVAQHPSLDEVHSIAIEK